MQGKEFGRKEFLINGKIYKNKKKKENFINNEPTLSNQGSNSSQNSVQNIQQSFANNFDQIGRNESVLIESNTNKMISNTSNFDLTLSNFDFIMQSDKVINDFEDDDFTREAPSF